MQRRDEALRATTQALEKQQESTLAIDNAILGVKSQIADIQVIIIIIIFIIIIIIIIIVVSIILFIINNIVFIIFNIIIINVIIIIIIIIIASKCFQHFLVDRNDFGEEQISSLLQYKTQ